MSTNLEELMDLMRSQADDIFAVQLAYLCKPENPRMPMLLTKQEIETYNSTIHAQLVAVRLTMLLLERFKDTDSNVDNIVNEFWSHFETHHNEDK